MKSINKFAAASCLGLLALVPSAVADQWNKKTYITISEAVQVPGKVLQPGRYVMRLMESPANRHVVQIFNEREDQLQTTVLAIPNYRLQPTGETEFQWWETPAGQPKAMRAWFYPGDNFGQEFAYPKTEAVAIATATQQSVPTTYAQTETELATARVGTVDKAGTELELDRKTYSRNDGAQPAEVAQNRVTPPAAEPVATPQEMPVQTAQPATPAARPETLPSTASNTPLVLLAGFVALGAGLAVRAMAGSRV